ncbi:MAG TPA: IS4 family transposase [Bacillota bacterium]|nr:IS4 family transposase [Bacillota bacterium]
MQDKDTTKSTFIQLFEPILSEKIFVPLKNLEADKYVKKLRTTQLLELIALAQLEQQRGLRDIGNSLNNEELSKAINLKSISASQISRRLKNLSSQAIQALFKAVSFDAGKKMGFDAVRKALGRINLIDSSTISLCFTQYPWAEFRETKSGVKLHLRLKFHENGVIPDEAVITPAKPVDKTQMEALVVEEIDALNVFDRGYVDYKMFDRYCENGTRFITRLKVNAVVEVVQEFSTDADSPIKKDCVVYLGTKNINRMQYPLRLLKTEDTQGEPVIILTNDFSLSASQICDIYRYRWQIELFFKWIKQRFRVKHFYGLSRQAVENQLFIALITYCLLMLVKLQVSYQGPLLAIKRLIHTCLYEPFTSFVQKLYRGPQRTSKGRRKVNHELIFRETLRQVMAGEVEHLNELTYDPVIL